jgi:hypothetical protein
VCVTCCTCVHVRVRVHVCVFSHLFPDVKKPLIWLL